MSTLLIVHGDEGNEAEIHAVILLDQTLTESQVDEKIDEMRDEIEEWIGEYDPAELKEILSNHGLSGNSLDVTISKGNPIPGKIYYQEVYC